MRLRNTRPVTVLFMIVATQLVACSSCTKPEEPPPTPPAAAAPSASAAPSAVVSAEPEADAAPAAVAAVSKAGPGGPWAGVYNCLNHLTLSQNGNSVVGRTKTGDDEDTYVCTISGDTCVGSQSRMHRPKGKPPTPGKTHRMTLKRDPNGTIHYSGEGNAPINCFK